MFVTDILIHREGYIGSWGKPDPTKPFSAKVGVAGAHGKLELQLSAEMSARIVEVIADEITAAARATAEAMTVGCLAAQATPALEGAK